VENVQQLLQCLRFSKETRERKCRPLPTKNTHSLHGSDFLTTHTKFAKMASKPVYDLKDLPFDYRELLRYKTQECNLKKHPHPTAENIANCSFAHSKHNDPIKRFPVVASKEPGGPLVLLYGAKKCPKKPGNCSDLNECTFAHNSNEVKYHPTGFKNIPCNKAKCVVKKENMHLCNYFHSPEEKRYLRFDWKPGHPITFPESRGKTVLVRRPKKSPSESSSVTSGKVVEDLLDLDWLTSAVPIEGGESLIDQHLNGEVKYESRMEEKEIFLAAKLDILDEKFESAVPGCDGCFYFPNRQQSDRVFPGFIEEEAAYGERTKHDVIVVKLYLPNSEDDSTSFTRANRILKFHEDNQDLEFFPTCLKKHIDIENQSLWLVLEHCGLDLTIGEFGDDLKSIFLQLVECIAYLHDQSFSHRDIKPQSFSVELIEGKFQVRLIDLEIVKKGELNSDWTDPFLFSRTSPRESDFVHNDVFSLMLVMAYLALGRNHPFKDRDIQQRMMNYYTCYAEDYDAVAEFAPDLSEIYDQDLYLYDLLSRGLHKVRTKRLSLKQIKNHVYFSEGAHLKTMVEQICPYLLNWLDEMEDRENAWNSQLERALQENKRPLMRKLLEKMSARGVYNHRRTTDWVRWIRNLHQYMEEGNDNAVEIHEIFLEIFSTVEDFDSWIARSFPKFVLWIYKRNIKTDNNTQYI
jgi:serine/threonine protein kinase